jgi:hypothetical protein
LELPHVETDRLHLGKLRHRDRGIGGEDRQAIGLGDIEDVVGGVEMGAAGHLPQDHRRIAGHMPSQMTADEQGRVADGAADPRADDDGDGLALVEVGLRRCGRVPNSGDRKDGEGAEDRSSSCHAFLLGACARGSQPPTLSSLFMASSTCGGWFIISWKALVT